MALNLYNLFEVVVAVVWAKRGFGMGELVFECSLTFLACVQQEWRGVYGLAIRNT